MEMKENETKRSSMASAVLHTGNRNKLNSSLNSSNSSNNISPEQMRRPFGVAVVDLTPVVKKPEDFKNNLDLPFILCEKENLDSTLRKLIANKDVGKIESKLAVSVELLHGDIKQVSFMQFLCKIRIKRRNNQQSHSLIQIIITLLLTR